MRLRGNALWDIIFFQSWPEKWKNRKNDRLQLQESRTSSHRLPLNVIRIDRHS